MSELIIDNLTFRIDSEYFKKNYLKNIRTLKGKKHIRLKNAIEHLSGGATPLGANYQTYGIKFLRVQNIMQNYFNLNDVVYIDAKQDEEIKRSRLKLKDVLLTITGISYGKSSTVNKELAGANINQHSVKITLNEKLNPYYLSTFLNSKYGKIQSDKNIVGVTRPALDYQVIKNFVIPQLNIDFQKEIEKTILNSELLTLNSKNAYTQAENLLLEEIGLQNFEPSKEPVNIKSFKDSFGTSGRLDAEYYQNKYDSYENRIRESVKDVVLINDVLEDKIKNGTTPKEVFRENGKINFIRVEAFKSDLDFDDNDCFSVSPETYESYTHNRVVKNDILVSMTGTIGNVSIYNSENKGLINQNLVKLTANTDLVSVNYLALYIKSVGSIFLTKLQTGNVQPYVNIPNFSNLIVPIIAYKKQQQITDLIEQSFTLKKQSEHLLEVAKRAVEIAIEENEKIALKYINQETK